MSRYGRKSFGSPNSGASSSRSSSIGRSTFSWNTAFRLVPYSFELSFSMPAYNASACAGQPSNAICPAYAAPAAAGSGPEVSGVSPIYGLSARSSDNGGLPPYNFPVLLVNDRSCLPVHHDELSARERAVLFALLAEARKLSNTELQALIGIRLDGKERRKLNDLKLVESEKPGRAFTHELSDAGWRWCADELIAGRAGRGTSLERSHYLVFGVFARYLSAAHLTL